MISSMISPRFTHRGVSRSLPPMGRLWGSNGKLHPLFPRCLRCRTYSHLPSHHGQILIVEMQEQHLRYKEASHNHQHNSLFLYNLIPNTKRNSGEMTKACSERV